MSEEIIQPAHVGIMPDSDACCFSGTFTPKMDDKGRFFVPTVFREYIEADGGCFITRGLDKCLWMYGKAEWERVKMDLNNNLLDMIPYERNFKRYLMGNSRECELDKQGRILIPQNLRFDAGITDSIIAVGMGNKIELWDPTTYSKPVAYTNPNPSDPRPEDLAAEIAKTKVLYI